MRRLKKVLCMGMLLAVTAGLLAGCGCGKKKDKETQEVVKITITPMPTPTPAPEELNPDAVVTKGGLTMVNDYLVEKGGENGEK